MTNTYLLYACMSLCMNACMNSYAFGMGYYNSPLLKRISSPKFLYLNSRTNGDSVVACTLRFPMLLLLLHDSSTGPSPLVFLYSLTAFAYGKGFVPALQHSLSYQTLQSHQLVLHVKDRTGIVVTYSHEKHHEVATMLEVKPIYKQVDQSELQFLTDQCNEDLTFLSFQTVTPLSKVKL